MFGVPTFINCELNHLLLLDVHKKAGFEILTVSTFEYILRKLPMQAIIAFPAHADMLL